jgi:peptidoglycan/LPS O-acetylase OafA/YrhL
MNRETVMNRQTAMSEPHPPRRIGRSIGAVLAGIVVGVILTLATDIVLHAIGVFPPWGQPVSDGPLLLATAYRAVFGIVGSYIAARLAPYRPMQHALAGGVVGLVVSIVGTVVTWNRGPAFGPHWYPLALIVIAMPCAWVGGKLFGVQSHARSAL